jgi:hypothetical protein
MNMRGSDTMASVVLVHGAWADLRGEQSLLRRPGRRNRVFPPVQKMPTIHASSGASRNRGHHDFAIRKLD